MSSPQESKEEKPNSNQIEKRGVSSEDVKKRQQFAEIKNWDTLKNHLEEIPENKVDYFLKKYLNKLSNRDSLISLNLWLQDESHAHESLIQNQAVSIATFKLGSPPWKWINDDALGMVKADEFRDQFHDLLEQLFIKEGIRVIGDFFKGAHLLIVNFDETKQKEIGQKLRAFQESILPELLSKCANEQKNYLEKIKIQKENEFKNSPNENLEKQINKIISNIANLDQLIAKKIPVHVAFGYSPIKIPPDEKLNLRHLALANIKAEIAANISNQRAFEKESESDNYSEKRGLLNKFDPTFFYLDAIRKYLAVKQAFNKDQTGELADYFTPPSGESLPKMIPGTIYKTRKDKLDSSPEKEKTVALFKDIYNIVNRIDILKNYCVDNFPKYSELINQTTDLIKRGRHLLANSSKPEEKKEFLKEMIPFLKTAYKSFEQAEAVDEIEFVQHASEEDVFMLLLGDIKEFGVFNIQGLEQTLDEIFEPLFNHAPLLKEALKNPAKNEELITELLSDKNKLKEIIIASLAQFTPDEKQNVNELLLGTGDKTTAYGNQERRDFIANVTAELQNRFTENFVISSPENSGELSIINLSTLKTTLKGDDGDEKRSYLTTYLPSVAEMIEKDRVITTSETANLNNISYSSFEGPLTFKEKPVNFPVTILSDQFSNQTQSDNRPLAYTRKEENNFEQALNEEGKIYYCTFDRFIEEILSILNVVDTKGNTRIAGYVQPPTPLTSSQFIRTLKNSEQVWSDLKEMEAKKIPLSYIISYLNNQENE